MPLSGGFLFAAMEDLFRFSAQPDLVVKEKPPESTFSAKRARATSEGEVCVRNLATSEGEERLRNPADQSFKSKLLNTSIPSSWSGFSAERMKLKIGEGDIKVTKGPNGPSMAISDELKLQLCKPWENALILKIMGRPHTLNYLLYRLRLKWQLLGQWQLTDLDDGYFVVRFQRVEDLEFVLTGGPWVIANQYLVVQKWRPNFVPGEEEIQRMPVWVRLSKLPMEWIDVDLLRAIGGLLGTTYKVDPITES